MTADRLIDCFMETINVIHRSKEILAAHYGDRLADLILYGSEARGEATANSDIDLLVLLKEPFNRLKELCAIVDLLYPVQLESDRLISARPAWIEDYFEGRLMLYRYAKSDGVVV